MSETDITIFIRLEMSETKKDSLGKQYSNK